MTLVVCSECEGRVSDKAFACPGCGYPMSGGNSKSGWSGVIGGVAGTYISAQALITIIVGCVMFLSFAAIMIAAILS